MKQGAKKYLEGIYKFFIKHWLISAFLSTIASLWFIIIQVLGRELKLVEDNGNLPLFSNIIFWICAIISVIYSTMKSKYDFQISKDNLSDKVILEEIISCNNAMYTKNVHNLLSYLEDEPKCNNEPLKSMFNSQNEAEELLEQLNLCFSKYLNIKRERIGLSIAIKINGEKKWKLLSKLHTSNNTEINTLFENSNSVAYSVIHEKKDFVFILDKNSAYKNHNYVRSGKDGQDVKGSIICCNIGVSHNGKKYVDAILSITTYEITICERDQEKEIQDTIKNIIIPGFQKYIDLLLLRHYIVTKNQENK